jgi:hypothetical protein
MQKPGRGVDTRREAGAARVPPADCGKRLQFLYDLPMNTYKGGCHCGRVRFEVEAPAPLEVLDCNCTMCGRSAYLHLIVAKAQFRLVSGADALTTYRFNTGAAQHLFCSVCGVKSFYVPRSHPDGYSVNARCLDGVALDELVVTPFDGRDWERAAAAL